MVATEDAAPQEKRETIRGVSESISPIMPHAHRSRLGVLTYWVLYGYRTFGVSRRKMGCRTEGNDMTLLFTMLLGIILQRLIAYRFASIDFIHRIAPDPVTAARVLRMNRAYLWAERGSLVIAAIIGLILGLAFTGHL